MFMKIFGAVAALIALLLVYAAVQPSEYFIARETVVKAPAEAIFPHINNSKKANDWMPWAASDPAIKMSFSGPDEGVGSTSSWDSTGQMGQGQAAVTESVPNQKVVTQLTYKKPMEMSQVAEMTLTPASEGTVVRWSVKGHNNFIGRLMCVFMDMDKMVGGEFEKGLAKLKTTVEAGR